MKITKLQIENLYGINELTELDLNDVLIAFWGDNGTGKTSIIESIRFAFDGKVKAGTKNHFADEGFVSITLDSGDVLTRVLTGTGKGLTQKVLLNDRKITQQDAATFMTDKLDIPQQNLRTFTSGELTDALSGDIGSVLLSYMDGTVEKSRIVKLITEHEKDNIHITKEDIEREFEKKAENLSINTDIATLCKIYTDRRKAGKASGREASAALKQLHITDEALDEEKINEELTSLRILLQNGEVARKLMLAWEENEKRRKSTLERIAALKEETDKITVVVSKEDSERLQEKKELLVRQISGRQADITAYSQEIKMLSEIKEKIGCGHCPLSTGDIKVECKTDMNPVIKDVVERIRKAEEKKTAAEEELNKLLVEEQKIKEQQEKLKKDTELYTKKSSLLERIKDLENTLPAKTEKPEIVDTTATKERVAELEKQVGQLKARKEAEAIKEKIKVLAKEVYLTDAIATALSKKEYVITALMKDYMELLNKAAEKSQGVTGVRAVFSYDDTIKVEFETGREKGLRPYYLLSTAEKMIASHTVSDLLMRLSGYSVCLIDDLDRLDDKNLDKFLALLEKNKDSYSNIIIAGVGHKGTEEILKTHGVTVMNCTEE